MRYSPRENLFACVVQRRSGVLVAVFRIGVLLLLQLRVAFFKGIGNVLEEDQTENDMLVPGSIHLAAQSAAAHNFCPIRDSPRLRTSGNKDALWPQSCC